MANPLDDKALLLKKLMEVAKDLELTAGQVIFREGDEDERLYIIMQGKVAITKRMASGEDQVIAEIGPGEFFGENMLINKKHKPAGAKAVQKTQLMVLCNDDFEMLIKKDAAMGAHFLRQILKLVGERLIHMNEQLVTLHEMNRLSHQYQDDVPGLAQATIDRLLVLTESDAGAVFLHNPYSNEYHTVYTTDERLKEDILTSVDPLTAQIVAASGYHYLVAPLGDFGTLLFRKNDKKPGYTDDKLRLTILVAQQLLHVIEGAAIRNAKKATDRLNQKRFSI